MQTSCSSLIIDRVEKQSSQIIRGQIQEAFQQIDVGGRVTAFTLLSCGAIILADIV